MNGRKIVEATKLMESINQTWCELEDHMGEFAALEVACEQHGKTSDWFYDNIGLIATKADE